MIFLREDFRAKIYWQERYFILNRFEALLLSGVFMFAECRFVAVDYHCAISSERQLTGRQAFGIEISGHTHHQNPTI